MIGLSYLRLEHSRQLPSIWTFTIRFCPLLLSRGQQRTDQSEAKTHYPFDRCCCNHVRRGETYVFDQLNSTNWFHPLGFAYLPDGAHEGVDELEEGVGNGEKKTVSFSMST